MPQLMRWSSARYRTEATMGQAGPFKPIALVVEDDVFQRELVVALLEESEMGVIELRGR